MSWRGWLLWAIAAAAIAGLALYGPIAQDPAYHRFADQRTVLGVPNLWNVASNIPFLLVGVYGLALLRRGHCGGALAYLRPAYGVFFVALALVAVGSAYYHLDPNDLTLVWDRLPMTLAFMAFFAAMLGEHVQARLTRLLVPLLLLGVASVVWWQFSGDLRFYYLIQFLPMLLMPISVVLYPCAIPGTRLVWLVMGLYIGAKAFELFDAQVFDVLGFSGHSLKHIAAALAVYFVAVLVKARPLFAPANRSQSGGTAAAGA